MSAPPRRAVAAEWPPRCRGGDDDFRGGSCGRLETYRQSAELYRNLFDPNILDWALDSSDESLSNALLHAMYLLSRWNFKTIHGDILSGVCDHYLDPSKRRALGEVFTRPEIARYMLERCLVITSKYGETKQTERWALSKDGKGRTEWKC